MTKIYNKLVRDNIPNIISTSGKKCKYSNCPSRLKMIFLYNKLVEEINELRIAKTKDEQIEELADIKEVLETISDFLGISENEVFERKIAKRIEKGSFKNFVVLESVEDD